MNRQKINPHLLSAGHFGLFQAKLLIELINTSTGVYQLLLACIKGVTLGTDLDLDVLLRASRLNNLTASTPYSGLLVIGMYPFLHYVHLFLCNLHAQSGF